MIETLSLGRPYGYNDGDITGVDALMCRHAYVVFTQCVPLRAGALQSD
ncbi:MAG: hypothetical protein J6V60_06430 [Muribaculaceae bacterium]|nr:hypothetical protein [Muribaculaceae bacterium]MBO7165701.1 hypothetical protein [Muribaculaceae bacterium]